MEIESGRIWLSEEARQALGLLPDERVTFESFLARLVEEDRARVCRAVQQAVELKGNLITEYRLAMPDGTVRWIAARGYVQVDAAGEPRRLVGVSIDVTGFRDYVLGLEAYRDDFLKLKEQMQAGRNPVADGSDRGAIVGRSEALQQTLWRTRQAARTDSTVLILGETGTGKELLARFIHEASPRKGRPFVVVNMAAMAPTLIESELFGRERGAFTGALTRQAGRFEVADGGTIFLDEIGEMSVEAQVKLLRVLEAGEFERLGSVKTLRVDVRVIAATNRDLAEAVQHGRFRQDLYYRLNIFPVGLPPLRERREDIPELVWTFVKEFSRLMGKSIDRVCKSDLAALEAYGWPGNIRELRNVVERSMILAQGTELHIAPPMTTEATCGGALAMADVERNHILRVLNMTKWRIRGHNGAAQMLGLKASTLYGRMRKLRIHRPT